MTSDELIFICHSSADKPAVRRLHDWLVADGFRPWLDEKDLLPGQAWELEIHRAIKAAAIILVCLSRDSIAKTGFVQREIKVALDAADERPPDAIYMIPVRLEECEIPERIAERHWVDLYEEEGYDRLKRALDNVLRSSEQAPPTQPYIVELEPAESRPWDPQWRVPAGLATSFRMWAENIRIKYVDRPEDHSWNVSLRRDGLYVEAEYGALRRYFRFMSNVEHCAVTSVAQTWEVAQWIGPGQPGVASGSVRVRGNAVEIVSHGQGEHIEYQGTINDTADKLQLTAHSDSGLEWSGIYHFEPATFQD